MFYRSCDECITQQSYAGFSNWFQPTWLLVRAVQY